ncbi:MAG TPA: septation protein SepH [Microbacteriaceae bacterium]
MKEVQFSHREGDYLVLQGPEGEQFRLQLNGELRHAIRNSDGKHTKFAPGEVQALIRSGLSLTEVSKKLAVEEDAIEPFAAPVIAELNYIKSAALSVLVVAQDYDETVPLETLLADKLGETEVKVMKGDSGWVITASVNDSVASFSFDPKTNWLKPINDQARDIFEEQNAPVPFSVIDTTPEEPESKEPASDASSVATDLLEELQRRRAQKESQPETPKPESSSKRPSLPSWDEIVFGAGESKNDKDDD